MNVAKVETSPVSLLLIDDVNLFSISGFHSVYWKLAIQMLRTCWSSAFLKAQSARNSREALYCCHWGPGNWVLFIRLHVSTLSTIRRVKSKINKSFTAADEMKKNIILLRVDSSILITLTGPLSSERYSSFLSRGHLILSVVDIAQIHGGNLPVKQSWIQVCRHRWAAGTNTFQHWTPPEIHAAKSSIRQGWDGLSGVDLNIPS